MKKYFPEKLWLFALLLGPVVLLLLPADFFNNGPVLCPSKLLFHLDCDGCGLTRGVMHAIHLDFERAISFNRASLWVAGAGIICWIQLLKNALQRLSTTH